VAVTDNREEWDEIRSVVDRTSNKPVLEQCDALINHFVTLKASMNKKEWLKVSARASEIQQLPHGDDRIYGMAEMLTMVNPMTHNVSEWAFICEKAQTVIKAYDAERSLKEFAGHTPHGSAHPRPSEEFLAISEEIEKPGKVGVLWPAEGRPSGLERPTCGRCKGTGWVHETNVSHNPRQRDGGRCIHCEDCPACEGTGTHSPNTVPCWKCAGRGWNHEVQDKVRGHLGPKDRKCVECAECDACDGKGVQDLPDDGPRITTGTLPHLSPGPLSSHDARPRIERHDTSELCSACAIS
jgi:hypothetical protein